MTTPKVFISYSHQDEEFKDRLLKHLSVGALKDALEVWHDRAISPGANWRQEIETALKDIGVAVLVISPDFLASDFAQRVEVPAILDRRKKEGVVVIPIIARPCLWHEADWLRSIQVLPKDGRPLAILEPREQDATYAELAQSIIRTWESVVAKSQQPTKKPQPTPRKALPDRASEFFISHCHADGDFAEVLKSRIEARGYQAWVDLERLNPGEDWRQGIDEAIQKCTALIVIMSPEAKQSEFVAYEWAFACGRGIKVIPIMLRQTSLHPRLETLQYLDFTNRAARPWDRLMQVLDKSSGDRADSA